MNYYPHHIGDYAAPTAHLSWDEDMALTRLLRVYYQQEKQLPDDLSQITRLARCTTPIQCAAVEVVLHEFFVREEDGWHQHRCDREIAAYRERVARARNNGIKGGRPSSHGAGVPRGPKPTGLIQDNPEITHPVNSGFTQQEISETQIETNQNQNQNHHQTKAKQKPPLPAALDVNVWEAFAEMRRKKRAALTPRAMELIFNELDKLVAQGFDQNAVLDQSTRNNWTDVYPLREKTANMAPAGGYQTNSERAIDGFLRKGD